MHIFITGGTGLIGRQLIEQLHRQHSITVLSRNANAARKALPGDVKVIADIDTLSDFNDFDAVINLAGEPIADKRWSEQQKYRICQSRWQLTSSIANKLDASDKPPAVFISGSAIGYYGRQGDTPITENNHQAHQEFTHEVCQQWESIAQSVSNTCRVCILRTGVVLAPDGGALSKMRLPFKLGLGGRIGSGKQYMSWIHIDDMVAGILFLLSQPELSGPFNFTAPNPVTNQTFIKAFASALNRPAFFPMPAPVLKLAMGEAADLLLTGQRVLPQKLQEAGFQFKYEDIDAAFADTES
ncbi:TIGR01777 family oxidoreductase [Alteromonas gilva]|uniref:TIGR01777 family oxidoreductase n=1 Tax=Alteromonas gilva TaxID=2987522 RepID=A0ABT5L3Y4_9ALTE|nr:TIGR01777 family oxidoreductase [Alteromonas gilva]MDC8831747.1 TIGR01777 family oxidoreductase [Alteromonas gilva]